MKTLLLCITLLALQINAAGQTATKTTHSVAEVKNEIKFKQEKNNHKETKNSNVIDGPAFHFFTLNPPVNQEGNFVFLVGSTKLSGYKLQVCNVTFNANTDINKSFKNGKNAPILQLFVAHKEKYIGGILEDEKGKKTTIKDATVVEDGNTVKFTVIGKEFSKSLTLENGEILNQNSTTLVLYTEKVGIWKIIKK